MKINIEKLFLDERVMTFVSILSAICGFISLIILVLSHEITLLDSFDKTVKLILTLLTLWTFSRFHWDAMKGLMGGLLFAFLYQECFLVLGKLWGETSDFDYFLVMGVQGSLYLAAESMSFLMTIIITINHFVLNYSRLDNINNVIFNQICIVFKIVLYLLLLGINVFLNIPLFMQINYGIEYLSDLCIIIMIICIDTHLDNFKAVRQDLKKAKKGK